VTGLEDGLDKELNKDGLQVVSFLGKEKISDLFHFEIDFYLRVALARSGQGARKPAQLSFDGPQGPRYVHGMVSRLQLRDRGRAHRVPGHLGASGLAAQPGEGCRIFQKESLGVKAEAISMKDIVEHILNHWKNRL